MTPLAVIARSPCDEAIQGRVLWPLDCFASLAMTVELTQQLLGVYSFRGRASMSAAVHQRWSSMGGGGGGMSLPNGLTMT